MRRPPHPQHPERPGAIAPLAAFLALFMVAMVAFAVDLSWVVLTQGELQNASDAAALAGANELLDDFVLYNLPNQSISRQNDLLNSAMSRARQTAKKAAALNGAGDQSTLLLRDEDIEFGFIDTKNVYTPLPNYPGFPNTVKVKLRRDTVANQPLGLSFSRAIGRTQVELAATASATLYAGVVDSFKVNDKYNVAVLPVTYDVNHWTDFATNGKDPDGKTRRDADGDPQLQVYPSIKYKGNFGLLSLNDNNIDANTIDSWIHNGMSAGDVQALNDHKLVPLSGRLIPIWDWNGSPGFKASNVMDMNHYYLGKSFLLPLYKPVVPTAIGYEAGIGQGKNYNFNIVAFVGVRIVQPDARNRDVVVQPAAVIEAEAIFRPGSLAPAQPGAGTTLQTTFTVPKLTR